MRTHGTEFHTLTELLQFRALRDSDRCLYTFLQDGENAEVHLSFRQLDRQARAIAAYLQSVAPSGERALLLYPPGLEFITAFFGCLYAGMIAVPAYPPRNPRHVPRIQTIAADSQARFCLTSSAVLSRSRDLVGAVPGLKEMDWAATDQIAPESGSRCEIVEAGAGTLAYLQYTSGSTSAPKGVMVTHGNLIHNLSYIYDGWGHEGQCRIASWLPFFHDMGLIYGVLQPLYGGARAILMAPASFLQRPFRWLQAISKYQANSAIAPNFAYELCAQKVSEEEKKLLDLSRWNRAHNAAEPVRPETLEKFARAFAPCGFKEEYLKPAYGLAEATLAASYSRQRVHFSVRSLERDALARHKIATATGSDAGLRIVGCGPGAEDQVIAIVHPETCRRCAIDEVGEIWIKGPSVAQGYWERPVETRETFGASIAGTGEGPFLRTGDLGFLHDGQLYVTGRVKDMIIVRGANHYPQDIELTAQKAHPALQPDGGAAFSVELEGEERLVLVQELIRHHKANLDEVVTAIIEAVAEIHGIPLSALLLVKPNSVPKTSSGKIQHAAARSMYLDGSFSVEKEWRYPMEAESRSAAVPASPAAESALDQRKDLENWIRSRLAGILHIAPESIDSRAAFSRYGLDSLGAMTLVGELQAKLGRELPSFLLFDFPSIDLLTGHLLPGDSVLELAAPRSEFDEPIAIVGLACRFPGADTPDEFWKILRDGIDAIQEVPRERWRWEDHYDPDPATPGKMNTRWGGFLKNVDRFDPEFFEISPREASQMDPQQRLLLEVAWEALESAGMPPAQIAGSKAGVFVGISGFDYLLLQMRDARNLDAYVGTGGAHSIAANRLSYYFDLRGPSVAVDTACSSSLVALHQACQSLRRGEASWALAGGVNLILNPELTVVLSQARMMASDGRCKTFDRRADGYVRGEGCGMIVLKRLSDAQRDGDAIWALVHGSAVNQDGRSNGLTAPNGPAQEAVVRAALDNAGVEPAQISYIECHGSGTPLGDPQEVQALTQVFSQAGRNGCCLLGSVKTNIGHLEAAAGIAGLIKVVLSLRHEEIPPVLHYSELNPDISLEKGRFAIASKKIPWIAGSQKLLAGVSSFGFGGTNAHVILGEAPPVEKIAAPPEQPLHLLAISARTPEALRVLAENYSAVLSTDNVRLPEICYMANAGRAHFGQRVAVLAETSREAAELLKRFSNRELAERIYPGNIRRENPPKIAFLFPGQGAQTVAMGRALYLQQPVFRKVLDECDEVLRPLLDQPLLSVLHSIDGENPLLRETLYVQCGLFAVEYGLAALWQSWGIQPAAVFGHSLGDFVAACVAGVFDSETALRLIVERARLMQSLPREGEMAAVFAGADVVGKAIEEFSNDLSIAAINGPGVTVISGRNEPLREVLERLKKKRILHQRINTAHAFHSPLLEPILKSFGRVASEFTFRLPALPMISNLNGAWVSSAPDAAYWTSQMREPVQFAAGIATLAQAGHTHFLECGPNPTLTTMGKRCLPPQENGAPAPVWLTSLQGGENDSEPLLDSLARLYAAGAAPDWRGVQPEERRRILALPHYPFQRQRCWVEFESATSASQGKTPVETDVWLEMVRAATRQAEAGLCEEVMEAEQKKFDALNAYSERCIAVALEQLQLLPARDDVASQPEFARLHASHQKKVFSWVRQHGTFPESFEDSEKLWEQVASLWDGEMELPETVRRCGAVLAEILEGKADPLDMMFPGGSWEAVAKIYRDARLSRELNEIICRIVQAFETGSQKPIRLIEIGGGTGGTTASLLASIDPASSSYYFTDVGSAFVQQARERFNAPHLECGILDIEKPPAGQGYPSQQFDIVIAANVLHATRNLRESVAHAKSLLRPGGILVLWETTRPHPYLSVTFGLLEGWNRFEDHALRSGSPLLNLSQWTALLTGSGFERAEVFPQKDSGELGQHVIVAQTQAAVEQPVTNSARGRSVHARPVDEPESGLLYTVSWEEAALAPIPEKISGQTWILIEDSSSAPDNLSDELEHRGARTLRLNAGQEFQAAGPGRFTLDPNNPDHLRLILEEITAMDWPGISHLVQFCGTGVTSGDPLSKAVYRQAGDNVLGLTLNLLRALRQNEPLLANARLWIVTRGAQGAGGPASSPAHGMVWGLGRTIALEQPRAWGGLIDLDPAAPAGEALELIRAMHVPVDNEMALRGEKVYTPRLIRRSSHIEQLRVPQIGPEGTYLITGGLGGIGRLVAEWLVEKGARRLLLLGRTGLPLRSNWRAELEKQTPEAEKIAAILQWESKGVSVHTAKVDLADEPAVLEFFSTFQEENWPVIRGVFHAAGVTQDMPIESMTPGAMQGALGAKAEGARVLARQFGRSADFLVFFSSASALFGAAGGGNYAAANAGLDSLASHLRGAGIHAVSINYGAWENVGLARQAAVLDQLAARGVTPISPAEALRGLECALHSAEPQTAVLSVDWSRLPATVSMARRLSDGPGALQKPSSPAGSSVEVFQEVRQYASSLLRVPEAKLPADRPLNALGLDSIMAVQMKNEIEVHFGTVISIQDLVRSSLRQITEQIDAERTPAKAIQ
jgi:acyl transferase domain-containing protein/acyl-CoA synthetase (AMP-forming)/AMP-acid ligase II/NAD(P)-dependent dehydrogenase (short-subunit alcohol dehydrogenase family)/acyl carrier protein/SAM-dependent methyltransferase